MSESIDKGNFIAKLEAFFLSCILPGWKDSIVTLASAVVLSEWSENLGITRKCIDSIVEKILTPHSKVVISNGIVLTFTFSFSNLKESIVKSVLPFFLKFSFFF